MLLIPAADGATGEADRDRLIVLARQHVMRFGERHAYAAGAGQLAWTTRYFNSATGARRLRVDDATRGGHTAY